jgi:nitroimidazol reductase NimA-like FMN-containing flavoprotein (pyridoxamine 5'-phosphate oxidase superfamily)
MLIDEGLEILDEDQCRELLAGAHLGRVGVTIAGLPVILPVNYGYVDGDVVFRTSAGTKLHAASDHAIIAFEVDAHDDEHRVGWSVLVIGHSSAVDDADDSARLDECSITPWAGGPRECYVRLRPEMITGRRIPAA